MEGSNSTADITFLHFTYLISHFDQGFSGLVISDGQSSDPSGLVWSISRNRGAGRNVRFQYGGEVEQSIGVGVSTLFIKLFGIRERFGCF